MFRTAPTAGTTCTRVRQRDPQSPSVARARGGRRRPQAILLLRRGGGTASPRAAPPPSWARAGKRGVRPRGEGFRVCASSVAGKDERDHEEPQWELSERDYPQGEVVLGLEIRAHTVKGALVDTGNGEFVRPGVVANVGAEGPDALIHAVQKVTRSYQWTGPVGCSVTKEVWRTLGREDSASLLQQSLPECGGEVATMSHKYAAAQAAFSFGEMKGDQKRVVVCTVGGHFGVVMYEEGQQVNRDLSQLTWTYASSLGKLQRRMGFEGVAPPFPEQANFRTEWRRREVERYSNKGDMGTVLVTKTSIEVEQWEAWVDLIAQYINKVASSLHPDTLMIVPTGSSALVPSDELQQCLDLRTHAGGINSDLRVVVPERPGGVIVKGAAKCSLEEYLHSMRAERKLVAAIGKRYVGNMYSMVALSEGKLQDLFKLMDANGDGYIDREDLTQATRALSMGLTQSEVAGLLKRLGLAGESEGTSQPGAVPPTRVTQAQIAEWCAQQYSAAKVQMVLSSPEFEAIVNDDAHEFKVVSFTSLGCRACKKMHRSFENSARQNPSVRFMMVNLDQNVSTQRLSARLGVEATPTFLFYHKGCEVDRHLGANIIKFEKALAGLLAISEEPTRKKDYVYYNF
mmetsp:Transcript_16775/g.36487  ORF Transcript_16775/g.36487 Transcript_16775/m.36487 type:complete len:628 (-) Transcript_16775:415-2298(-)